MRRSKKFKALEIQMQIIETKSKFVMLYTGDQLMENLIKAIESGDVKTLEKFADFHNQLLCETKLFLEHLKG